MPRCSTLVADDCRAGDSAPTLHSRCNAAAIPKTCRALDEVFRLLHRLLLQNRATAIDEQNS